MGHHPGQDFCSSEMFRAEYSHRNSKEHRPKSDDLIQPLPRCKLFSDRVETDHQNNGPGEIRQ